MNPTMIFSRWSRNIWWYRIPDGCKKFSICIFNGRYPTRREDDISVILDNRFSDNFEDIYNGSDVSFFCWKQNIVLGSTGTEPTPSFSRVFLCSKIPAVIPGIIRLKLTEHTKPVHSGELGGVTLPGPVASD